MTKMIRNPRPKQEALDATKRRLAKIAPGGFRTGEKPGAAPNYLGKVGVAAYNTIVRDLDEMGVLDRADALAIELLAVAYQEFRLAQETIDKDGATYESFNQHGELQIKKHPAVEIASNAWTRIRSLIPELYLTSLARLKASPGGATEPSDPFSEFLRPGKS